MLYHVVRCFFATSVFALAEAASLGGFARAGDLPRLPPREPSNALEAFHLVEGFRIELAASEPLVADPVALAFDADSRLYVVEMCDYSELDKGLLGRVRLLEDVDGDGRFDRSVIFADKLSWPTAVLCYDGGVFVGAAPEILYLRDDDGDLRADVRRVALTGFERTNVQGLLNSFQWGLDNRIHGATSSSGGLVRRPDDPPSAAVDLKGRDFAWDPRTGKLEAESGGAQHGLSFNRWGDKFVCHNSDHCQYIVAENRYLERNPYLSDAAVRRSIAADGPQAEVYRTSPDEPWRVLRTRQRVRGESPGVVEGGGRASGYFTSGTGITSYEGDNWPEAMRGLLLVGDVGSNLVHRKRLASQGASYSAERIDERRELLTSDDTWFRPVQMANGPDGALYVADMYREVIEHPLSLPPNIKQQVDLLSGSDRGRIYRIVHAEHRPSERPKLAHAPTERLAALLDQRNGWLRTTAARLLYERQDPQAVRWLVAALKNAQLPEGRIAILSALAGQGGLDEQTILAALDDAHAEVRRRGVRLAEGVMVSSPAVRQALSAATRDPSPRVLQQLAFTLGEASLQGAVDAQTAEDLAAIARRGLSDAEILRAVQSSLGKGAGPVLDLLWEDAEFVRQPPGREFVKALLRQIGQQQTPSDIGVVVQLVERAAANDSLRLALLLNSLNVAADTPLDRRLRDERVVGPLTLETLWRRAAETALSAEAEVEDRVESVASLRWANEEKLLEIVDQLLQPDQPALLQAGLLSALAGCTDERAAEKLIAHWSLLTPSLRDSGASLLLSRSSWALKALLAIRDKRLAAEEFGWRRLAPLATHPDPEIRRLAESLQPPAPSGGPDVVLAAYRDVLSAPGDAATGEGVFRKHCAGCHQHRGVGTPLGPNLTMAAAKGRETVLFNILTPNNEVDPRYVAYSVETIGGKILSGMIASESATAITLQRGADAVDTVPRASIEEIRSTGKSLMPEGLARDIDRTALAHLLTYLCGEENP